MKFEITQTQINQILTLLNQCEVKGVAQMVVMLTSLQSIKEEKLNTKAVSTEQ